MCDQPPVITEHLSNYRQADVSRRPAVGVTVDVRNVTVSAVDGYLEPGGSTGDTWVQEYITEEQAIARNLQGCAPVLGTDGSPIARVCGVQLFGASLVPAGSHLLPGDLVNVSGGIYEEFNCTPCCPPPRAACPFADGRSLPELSRTTVERVGSSRVPEPVRLTLRQIVDAGDAYVGVLVRITDDIDLAPPDVRGEFNLSGSGIKMAAQLTRLVDRATGMPLEGAQRLRNLTGIVSYFYGPKFFPRSTLDYDVIP